MWEKREEEEKTFEVIRESVFAAMWNEITTTT